MEPLKVNVSRRSRWVYLRISILGALISKSSIVKKILGMERFPRREWTLRSELMSHLQLQFLHVRNSFLMKSVSSAYILEQLQEITILETKLKNHWKLQTIIYYDTQPRPKNTTVN